MRIGIDATAVGAEPSTGMGVYGFNLVRNLIEIDNWNQYVIYCRHTVHDQFKGVGERITFKVSPINNRKVAEQFWLPVTTIGDRLDVFHGLCGLPRFAPKTSVLTIHGLSWRIMPEVFTRTQRLYWVHCAEGMMRTAKRLIAVSRWTRNLMHERFGIPAERIDVVHHGVNRNEFPHVGDARVIADMRRRHNLPEQYILFVGSVLPVKNVPVLVEAYQQLIRDERFARLKLVIAGIKGWGYAEAEQAVRDRGLNDRVMFTGKFPANDLPTLYSAAELFVLPSKYEGFGMPLIEAFSCGVPVVSTNASCLPEVAGDAAMLVEPGQAAPLCEAMAGVLSNAARRRAMIEAGYARAEEFTWRKTAEKTLRTYEIAAAG